MKNIELQQCIKKALDEYSAKSLIEAFISQALDGLHINSEYGKLIFKSSPESAGFSQVTYELEWVSKEEYHWDYSATISTKCKIEVSWTYDDQPQEIVVLYVPNLGVACPALCWIIQIADPDSIDKLHNLVEAILKHPAWDKMPAGGTVI